MKNIVFKVASVIALASCLTTFVPNQLVFADEVNSQQNEDKNVTTQTLYWQCIEQDTGKVLKTIKVDTVKVVGGVPERKFFHMGHLPQKIGNLEIAGNPWGGRDLEVDPNNKSGVVYLKAGYWDAEAFKERSKNNFGWGDPKHQGIINTTLMEYKAYHGTADGYIAPGYYDDDNMFHATMTVDEWIKKNHMPTRDRANKSSQPISKKDQNSEDNETKSIISSEIEESDVSTSSSKDSKKKSNYKKIKIVNKNETNEDKAEKHNSWILVSLLGVVIVIGLFLIPKKFWRKIFGGKGRHSK